MAAGPPPATGAASRGSAPASVGRPVSVEPTVSLDTLPSSPPPEVLHQLTGAARTYDSLRAQGRELRFSRDTQSGRTTIEVRDRGGNVLRTISPSQALEIAAGAPLE
jgi:hypothetical protein